MNLYQQSIKFGLVKPITELGGSIHSLLIPAEITNGTGLMNPSVYVDNGVLLCNIRHVNYTLYHSENKKFQHRYGPLQYLHPENDRHLRTWNYLAILNDDLSIKHVVSVDTSKLDSEPQWEFVGLEDARLFRWDNKLYLCGVRRDTTTNGEGRMELSEIRAKTTFVDELSRTRIPTPDNKDSYCEKNWMPIIDKPYHFVKWSNPTEVVHYDIHSKITKTVHLDESKFIPDVPAFRGSSHVVPYGDHYLAVTHEVNLFKSEAGEKDAVYRHRFVVWDKQWNIVKYTEPFSFMAADVEFCCGAAFYKDSLLLSFGFQDNCAFILKIPQRLLDELLNLVPPVDQSFAPTNFDWGKFNNNDWFRNIVSNEIFKDNVYQRFYPVEEGDVVLDVGASVGPFSWSISDKRPSKIYCLEPETDLFKTLVKNLATIDVPLIAINKALGARDGVNYLAGLYDETKRGITDGTDGSMIDTIKFSTLVRENNIKQIDFLKTDCEGGEYDIFNDENFDWIIKNVKKVAGEFHLNTPELKNKFRKFRDTYLRQLTTHRVLSLDYVDIKHDLWCDWFIEYYSAINLYIDNRVALENKKKWAHYPAPTLEITTSIPEKGCVVDCVFCPQRLLEKSYNGKRIMTLKDFKSMIKTVSTDVRITFSGFVEPWMNKYCTDMVLYAHKRGHPVSVFTTGIGMSVEDITAIAHIPFAGGPNGGFTLHLPDSELLAKHPITPGYIKLLEWFKNNHTKIKNFTTMTMGTEVHPAIKHLFDWAPSYQMWDRAGNLTRESILKPELLGIKNRWNRMEHTDGPRTCGCVENLYHNVLLPNGDVSLCCMDYGLDNIIGNLNTQHYEDVIPEAQTCYKICNSCENAAHPALKPVNFYPNKQ